MDDCAEWACTGRVNRIPRGCDQQGRYPQAAEAATEIGADGVPDVWESADGEVFMILAKAIAAMAALVFTIWMLQP
jgi:hypothetical protein